MTLAGAGVLVACMSSPSTVVLLGFEDVEVLDLCGPYEVFSVTAQALQGPSFETHLAAPGARPFRARNGLVMTPDSDLDAAPPARILVVPGGRGTRALMGDETVLEWIRAMAADAEYVLSVCTGSLLLGVAGLLNGLEATTHWSCLDLLREAAPKAKLTPGVRFADNGKIVTAAGISAGIDGALRLVGKCLGEPALQETARYMEYELR